MKKSKMYVAPLTSVAIVNMSATILAASENIGFTDEDVDNSDKVRPFFNPDGLKPWHGNMNRNEW